MNTLGIEYLVWFLRLFVLQLNHLGYVWVKLLDPQMLIFPILLLLLQFGLLVRAVNFKTPDIELFIFSISSNYYITSGHINFVQLNLVWVLTPWSLRFVPLMCVNSIFLYQLEFIIICLRIGF